MPAPLEGWMQDTVNFESHDDDHAWIGEVMSRGLRKNWNVKFSKLANKITLKGTVNKIFLETMLFLSIIHSECFSHKDYVEGMVKKKIGIELVNVGQ